MRKTLKRQTYA